MKPSRLAIVSARGLGDGLLSMVMANNLQRYHYSVVTYSSPLCELCDWFPGQLIKRFPENSQIDLEFNQYDKILSVDASPLENVKHNLGVKHQIFYRRDFDRNKSVLHNFIDICQKEFALPELTINNGLQIPQGLNYRKYSARIIIHPASSDARKNWPIKKFLQLAKELQGKKFEPIFVVSASEMPEYQSQIQSQFPLLTFSTMSALAKFVYESGYMIGNDSGIGHLASNMNIPTLSLFSRKSSAILWRPSWGYGDVVLPIFQLPTRNLRVKYWKQFLTVNRVLLAFENLLEKQKTAAVSFYDQLAMAN